MTEKRKVTKVKVESGDGEASQDVGVTIDRTALALEQQNALKELELRLEYAKLLEPADPANPRSKSIAYMQAKKSGGNPSQAEEYHAKIWTMVHGVPHPKIQRLQAREEIELIRQQKKSEWESKPIHKRIAISFLHGAGNVLFGGLLSSPRKMDKNAPRFASGYKRKARK